MNAQSFFNLFRKKNRISFIFVFSFIASMLTLLYVIYRDDVTPLQLGETVFEGKGLQYAVDSLALKAVENGAPGAVILIQKDGKQYIASNGLANKLTQSPMPRDEPLRIGSISKVYTALVILELIKTQRLDIDQQISDILPNEVIKDLQHADTATIRQLLNHTAGIPDYYDYISYFTQDWESPITLERTLPIAKNNSSDIEQGKQFEYSNMGYVLLGEVAETVTGLSLAQLIEQLIIAPLGLSNTYYNEKHPSKSTIHGYGTVLRPWADTFELWEHSGPDAGVVASASDTAKFLASLTLRSGDFSQLGNKMLEQTIKSGSNKAQGLGLMTIHSKTSNVTLVGHTGDVFGYQTIAFAWPEQDAVFVAHVNCDCTALTNSLIKSTYLAISSN
jgi:D-alanyl-D-alanine carboxypeptidase